jgi:hypothetical protein
MPAMAAVKADTGSVIDGAATQGFGNRAAKLRPLPDRPY